MSALDTRVKFFFCFTQNTTASHGLDNEKFFRTDDHGQNELRREFYFTVLTIIKYLWDTIRFIGDITDQQF